jgi:hypothetical protein
MSKKEDTGKTNRGGTPVKDTRARMTDEERSRSAKDMFYMMYIEDSLDPDEPVRFEGMIFPLKVWVRHWGFPLKAEDCRITTGQNLED